MFLQLIIFQVFTVFAVLNHLSDIMLSVSRLLAVSCLVWSFSCFIFTLADHVGVEGHYHWLMQLIVVISFVSALSAACFPTNFLLALALTTSIVFQGCWFINLGFMSWVPTFIPQGCTMLHQMNGGNSSTHVAVMCLTRAADSRARARANLQFCWILAAILIFIACTSLSYNRNCKRRRQSPEYEQFQTMV